MKSYLFLPKKYEPRTENMQLWSPPASGNAGRPKICGLPQRAAVLSEPALPGGLRKNIEAIADDKKEFA